MTSQMASLDISQSQSPTPLPDVTRPAELERSTSQASNVVQAPQTPAHELSSVSPPVATPTEAHQETELDPRVSELRAMFPDLDVAILESVLEACDWDPAKAIDMLLGMSDPNYKPPPVASQVCYTLMVS